MYCTREMDIHNSNFLILLDTPNLIEPLRFYWAPLNLSKPHEPTTTLLEAPQPCH